MAGRTTLVITHRASVARAMDVTVRTSDPTWNPAAGDPADREPRGSVLAAAF